MGSTLYIVRGLPGSGKSTKARSMVRPGRSFETDAFMVGADGGYLFDRDRLAECHDMCFHAVESAMADGSGEDVAVANTFTRAWEYQPYLDLAARLGWSVEIVYPGTDWAWDVAECARRNVHGVPVDVIRIMAERFECGELNLNSNDWIP